MRASSGVQEVMRVSQRVVGRTTRAVADAVAQRFLATLLLVASLASLSEKQVASNDSTGQDAKGDRWSSCCAQGSVRLNHVRRKSHAVACLDLS